MRRVALTLALLGLAGCGGGDTVEGPAPSAPEKMRLVSPAFPNGGTIPERFTCDGKGVSPPLRWSRVPRGAAELALLVQDPDAPGGTFVHWSVLRLRPSLRRLAEDRVPKGALQTEQSFGARGYGGPCPPEDDPPHHYVFDLYALDRPLGLSADASLEEVRAAIRKVAVARGRLRASYGR
jgi:Raf kinase inhibitor-like YbhB/YbcL family protein